MRTGITWYGGKEKERMARVADSLARVRTERDLKRLDSLAKIKDPEVFSKLNFRIPIGYGNNKLVLELLKKKAAIYKQRLRENPTFFVDNNFAVLSPLQDGSHWALFSPGAAVRSTKSPTGRVPLGTVFSLGSRPLY